MSEFMLTHDKLSKILKNSNFIEEWYNALADNLPKYDIITVKRISAFIAQCMHESNRFRTLTENLNYSAEGLMKTWPRHFPNPSIAQEYARQPEKIANRAYANRMGNGNEDSGDGYKYSGKGLIQLTGKNNYQAFAKAVDFDLDLLPEYLVSYNGSVHSACWFWDINKLNDLADKDDIKTMTRRINGGTLGLDDRIKHYNHIVEILSN